MRPERSEGLSKSLAESGFWGGHRFGVIESAFRRVFGVSSKVLKRFVVGL